MLAGEVRYIFGVMADNFGIVPEVTAFDTLHKKKLDSSLT